MSNSIVPPQDRTTVFRFSYRPRMLRCVQLSLFGLLGLAFVVLASHLELAVPLRTAISFGLGGLVACGAFGALYFRRTEHPRQVVGKGFIPSDVVHLKEH
jgi:hypothetical protein